MEHGLLKPSPVLGRVGGGLTIKGALRGTLSGDSVALLTRNAALLAHLIVLSRASVSLSHHTLQWPVHR